MPKPRSSWLVIPCALLLVGYWASFFTAKVVGPEARTRYYFAAIRGWSAHWPFETGKNLPAYVYPTVQPLSKVWMQVEPHVNMLLDPNDLVSRAILEKGSWEPNSQKIVAQHLPPGATFIDVGAHIGTYSLKAAVVVGPTGHVLAIEPNPPTLRVLEGNIAASGATVIRVWPVACSDRPGILELFAAPQVNTGESSFSHDNASQFGEAVASYKVRSLPLDTIVAESKVSRVDAIKIDVEGAELMVLKGAAGTLDHYHPAILIELIEHQLNSMGTTVAEVKAFLTVHGYKLGRQDGPNSEFVAAQ